VRCGEYEGRPLSWRKCAGRQVLPASSPSRVPMQRKERGRERERGERETAGYEPFDGAIVS